MANVLVRIESDLPTQEAIEQFEQNCTYSFKDTNDCTVIETNWCETEKISVRETNKSETEVLIKPLKNEPKLKIGD